MRSSQFRGITLDLQRDTPCTGALPQASSDAFRNIHHWQLNEKIFRCQPQFYFFKKS